MEQKSTNAVAGPRPSRQGFAIKQWPKEHLAYNYALWEATPGWSWKRRLEFLAKVRPDIPAAYLDRNERELAPNHISNRVDKAHRYGELERYAELVPAAKEEVIRALGHQP
jgi:hypothetical protein